MDPDPTNNEGMWIRHADLKKKKTLIRIHVEEIMLALKPNKTN